MTVERMVITTAEEGMMTEIAEAMTVIDMTTAETLTIIVKTIKNRNLLSESW
jgi:quinol monooxygenase YgiN